MGAKDLGTLRRAKKEQQKLKEGTEYYTIKELLDLMESKKLVVEIYQRAQVWSPQKQKNLIKEVLKGHWGIIPPLSGCVSKGKRRKAVLDGLQRLTSFSNWFNNKIKITKAEFLELINDPKSPYKGSISKEDALKLNKHLYFKHLPEKIQKDMLNTPLIFLNKGSFTINEQANIFRLINMGNPVNRSQKRKGKFITEENALFCTHIMACADDSLYRELFEKNKTEIEQSMVTIYGVMKTCKNAPCQAVNRC